jgi:hypothetical protein
MIMTDREFYDLLRQRALRHAQDACKMLTPDTTDGTVAPCVAKERILKLRRLARQIEALADWVDANA